MEDLIYYSRNRKQPPFEVTIQVAGKTISINCNCSLGEERKICRHKINAIRGDKQKSAQETSGATIEKLRMLFGTRSTLRQHLEEKWRMLREYANEHPENEEEIQKKRKILGEAFANGFVNEIVYEYSEPFDIETWEENREVHSSGLKSHVTMNYLDNSGEQSTREVEIKEVFSNNSTYYFLGHCFLRNQERSFRIDRILGITFQEGCEQVEKSTILNFMLQAK